MLLIDDPWIPLDMEIPRRGAVPIRFFGTYNFTWIESQRNLMPFELGLLEDLPAKGADNKVSPLTVYACLLSCVVTWIEAQHNLMPFKLGIQEDLPAKGANNKVRALPSQSLLSQYSLRCETLRAALVEAAPLPQECAAKYVGRSSGMPYDAFWRAELVFDHSHGNPGLMQLPRYVSEMLTAWRARRSSTMGLARRMDTWRAERPH